MPNLVINEDIVATLVDKINSHDMTHEHVAAAIALARFSVMEPEQPTELSQPMHQVATEALMALAQHRGWLLEIVAKYGDPYMVYHVLSSR